jgi:hypothetical protein
MSIQWALVGVIACGFVFYRYQLNEKKIKSRYPDVFNNSFTELDDFELRILKNHQSNRRTYAISALLIVGFSIWMGAWRPYQVNVERENQRQAYLTSYAEGWNFYCKEIFDDAFSSISPNGILYAGSVQFSSSWCRGLIGYGDAEQAYLKDGGGAMSEFSDVDASKSDGLNAGYRDSRMAVFSSVPYLCYGTECISEDSETSRIEDRAYQDWKLDQEYNYDPGQ